MKREWMKWIAVFAFVMFIPGAVFCEENKPGPPGDQASSEVTPQPRVSPSFSPEFKKREQITSYAIGVETARQFKRQGAEIDPDFFVRGVKDILNGWNILLSEEQLSQTLLAYFNELKTKKGIDRMLAGDENRKEGLAFLEENQKKDGVITLPSGLQYKVLKKGAGKKPVETDTVVVNARGTFIDGAEFFNSKDTGLREVRMADALNVIPGVREALKLMPVGSKWQLFIPHTLAYGQRGNSPKIGPYTTIVYELELVSIR